MSWTEAAAHTVPGPLRPVAETPFVTAIDVGTSEVLLALDGLVGFGATDVVELLATRGLDVAVRGSAGTGGTLSRLLLTVPRIQIDAAVEALRPSLRQVSLQTREIATITVVGAGLRSDPRVLSSVFRGLRAAQVPIELLVTSETSVRIAVPIADAGAAQVAVVAALRGDGQPLPPVLPGPGSAQPDTRRSTAEMCSSMSLATPAADLVDQRTTPSASIR